MEAEGGHGGGHSDNIPKWKVTRESLPKGTNDLGTEQIEMANGGHQAWGRTGKQVLRGCSCQAGRERVRWRALGELAPTQSPPPPSPRCMPCGHAKAAGPG